MADFIHMSNIIQGEVLRIKERRPLEERYGELEALEVFLYDQARSVVIEKIRVQDQLSTAEENPTPTNESAPDKR